LARGVEEQDVVVLLFFRWGRSALAGECEDVGLFGVVGVGDFEGVAGGRGGGERCAAGGGCLGRFVVVWKARESQLVGEVFVYMRDRRGCVECEYGYRRGWLHLTDAKPELGDSFCAMRSLIWTLKCAFSRGLRDRPSSIGEAIVSSFSE
jgi:hypothetical protein